jgi:hypothetical protein
LVAFPLSIGGKVLLVRVGHAAFGWRTGQDYLFAAYKLSDDRLAPVAGIFVTKTRSNPIEATVSAEP